MTFFWDLSHFNLSSSFNSSMNMPIFMFSLYFRYHAGKLPSDARALMSETVALKRLTLFSTFDFFRPLDTLKYLIRNEI